MAQACLSLLTSLFLALHSLNDYAVSDALKSRLQVAALTSRDGVGSARGRGASTRSIMTPATTLVESQPLLFDSPRSGKTQSIQVINHHMVYDKENNMNMKERQSQAEVSHKKRILNKSHKR